MYLIVGILNRTLPVNDLFEMCHYSQISEQSSSFVNFNLTLSCHLQEFCLCFHFIWYSWKVKVVCWQLMSSQNPTPFSANTNRLRLHVTWQNKLNQSTNFVIEDVPCQTPYYCVSGPAVIKSFDVVFSRDMFLTNLLSTHVVILIVLI